MSRCADCRHFVSRGGDPGERWDCFGDCKRYPPVWMPEDRTVYNGWTVPVVEANDICGEWMARDELVEGDKK